MTQAVTGMFLREENKVQINNVNIRDWLEKEGRDERPVMLTSELVLHGVPHV